MPRPPPFSKNQRFFQSSRKRTFFRGSELFSRKRTFFRGWHPESMDNLDRRGNDKGDRSALYDNRLIFNKTNKIGKNEMLGIKSGQIDKISI